MVIGIATVAAPHFDSGQREARMSGRPCSYKNVLSGDDIPSFSALLSAALIALTLCTCDTRVTNDAPAAACRQSG